MMSHALLPKLRQLKLSGMGLTLELRATQARDQGLGPIEFLALLLDDELERRSQQRLTRRLAQSGCNAQKILAHFDFAAAPEVNRSLIHDLATCAYLPRHENILFCGPTGVGKSHLANALGIEALKRGFRVFSRSTHRLLADLQAARANGTHHRLLARLLEVGLLTLDDLAYSPCPPRASRTSTS